MDTCKEDLLSHSTRPSTTFLRMNTSKEISWDVKDSPITSTQACMSGLLKGTSCDRLPPNTHLEDQLLIRKSLSLQGL